MKETAMTNTRDEAETVFVYVGVSEGYRVAVMVDRPEYKKSTAEELSRWVRDGYAVQRETLTEFRKNGLNFKCVKP